MFESTPHSIASLSTIAAVLPAKRCILLKDYPTLLLIVLASATSFGFHWLHPDHSRIRLHLPALLLLDRVFACALAIRIFSLPPTKEVFRHAFITAAPIGLAASLAGACSELARGTWLYFPLHSVWHVLIFVATDMFLSAKNVASCAKANCERRGK